MCSSDLSLYTRDTDYVLMIPSGFSESLELESTSVPGSTAGYYLNNAINTFVRTIKAYEAAGYSLSEALHRAIEISKTKAEVERVNTSKINDGEVENYVFTLRYFPYLYMSAMIYSVGGVLKSLPRPRNPRAHECLTDTVHATDCRKRACLQHPVCGVLACMPAAPDRTTDRKSVV